MLPSSHDVISLTFFETSFESFSNKSNTLSVLISVMADFFGVV